MDEENEFSCNWTGLYKRAADEGKDDPCCVLVTHLLLSRPCQLLLSLTADCFAGRQGQTEWRQVSIAERKERERVRCK